MLRVSDIFPQAVSSSLAAFAGSCVGSLELPLAPFCGFAVDGLPGLPCAAGCISLCQPMGFRKLCTAQIPCEIDKWALLGQRGNLFPGCCRH